MKNFSSKMRENSHRNSRRIRVFRIVTLTLILILALFLFGTYTGRITSFVTTPIYAFTRWFKESSAPLPLYIRARSELIEEIHGLKEELSAKSGSDATIARLQVENDTLQGLLSIKDLNRIASGILARPPRLPYDALLIDRGTDDGIHEGAVAYYAHDQAVGFVSKAFNGSSLITLFSSSGVTGTAYIFGPDIYVEMYGEGGGVIRLSVPQGVTVSKGNVVVLPGLPVGILGMVSEIRSVPTEPEQQVYVTYNVPIQSLREVAVSTRTIEPITFEEAQERISTWDYHDLGVDVPEKILKIEDGQGSSTLSEGLTE